MSNKPKVITEDQAIELLKENYRLIDKDILIDIMLENLMSINPDLNEIVANELEGNYVVVPDNKATHILYKE